MHVWSLSIEYIESKSRRTFARSALRRSSSSPSFLYFSLTSGENNTIIEALHGNVTAISGQKAILTCIFDTTNQALSHLSNHQLIWIRQNHATYDADLILGHNQDLLISDQRLNIQRTNLDYSLTIVNATVEDEGNYACEINTQPPQRALVHLSIQGKRHFSLISSQSIKRSLSIMRSSWSDQQKRLM